MFFLFVHTVYKVPLAVVVMWSLHNTFVPAITLHLHPRCCF